MLVYVSAKTMIDGNFKISYAKQYNVDDPEELSYIDDFISDLIKDIPVYLIKTMLYSTTNINFTFLTESHAVKVKLGDYMMNGILDYTGEGI